jgi:predicted metal-binding protein
VLPGKESDLSGNVVSSADTADFESDGQACAAETLADVTILVCSTCRDESDADSQPRAGMVLAEGTSLAAAGAISVRTVACLGNCRRSLSAALLRKGGWSYVFGGLSISDGPDLVAGAELLARSADGMIPWRERPSSLKRGLVARIPSLDQLKDLP